MSARAAIRAKVFKRQFYPGIGEPCLKKRRRLAYKICRLLRNCLYGKFLVSV